MDKSIVNIEYDVVRSYELSSGFAGLAEFLESRGYAKLIRGESCTKTA